MLGAKTENSTESIEDSLSKMDNVEIMSKTKDGVSVKCNGYQFFIDNDKNEITIINIAFKKGSTTYLTQDLKSGDTEIHLQDASKLAYDNGNDNGIIVWNYKDSTGHQYPEETYSRNVYSSIIEKDNIDKESNIIKLKNT